MADEKERDEELADDEADEAAGGDEDAEEASAGEADDGEAEDADDDGDADDAGDEDDAGDDEDEAEAGGDDGDDAAAGEDDEDRAADVAKALGVDDGDEDEAEAAADERPLNRAERRRRRAQRRRAGRLDKTAPVEDDELVPRDRNRRRKQRLLERRKAAAEADDEAVPDRLLPSEMVDDALARGADKTIKWVRENWKWLQWAIVGVVVVGIGGLVYKYRTDEATAEASDALATAIEAEQAYVVPEDQDDRTEEQKKLDVRKIFTTWEAKQQAALDAYRAVAADGTEGARILARLGEAGVLFDRADWDGAIAAYSEVIASQLAKADKDVHGRALEGLGFAQEAKGDLDAALKSFEALAEVGTPSFKAVGMYHQARIHKAKGDKPKAIELLTQARKDIEKAKIDATLVTPMHPFRWIDRAIEDELRELDPSAVPPKVNPGGGLDALPEHIKQQLRDQGLVPGMPGLPE